MTNSTLQVNQNTVLQIKIQSLLCALSFAALIESNIYWVYSIIYMTYGLLFVKNNKKDEFTNDGGKEEDVVSNNTVQYFTFHKQCSLAKSISFNNDSCTLAVLPDTLDTFPSHHPPVSHIIHGYIEPQNISANNVCDTTYIISTLFTQPIQDHKNKIYDINRSNTSRRARAADFIRSTLQFNTNNTIIPHKSSHQQHINTNNTHNNKNPFHFSFKLSPSRRNSLMNILQHKKCRFKLFNNIFMSRKSKTK
ncbi:hypothetical protein BDB01DRAFT_193697 [Pilobolus umbonatus]|nr:hypothetical protein BDB01DRAFT_193697 [Pilobolus umbonatus]